MRVQLGVALFSLLYLTACFGSSFQSSGPAPAWYVVTHRDSATVRLLTARPDADKFVEIGLVAATGRDTDDAISRARAEAAFQGCDALLILGEAVESGHAGPGESRHDVRGACFVEIPEGKRPPKPAPSASTVAAEGCVPACRKGFVCVNATCVSACNPPCPAQQQCVVEPGGPNCITSPSL